MRTLPTRRRVATRLAVLALLALVLSSRRCAASPTESNATAVASEEDDDDALEDITFEEFKERYRRLIPFMTFYVANNNVNSQTPELQSYPGEPAPSASPLIRRPYQYAVARPDAQRNRGTTKFRASASNQEKKFVPSVRFDPTDLGGGDGDYFVPVRYAPKINYEDYPGVSYQNHQLYQARKPSYPDAAASSGQISHKENLRFGNARPARPYSTNHRDYLPSKPPKAVPSSSHEDSADYARPSKYDYQEPFGYQSGLQIVQASNGHRPPQQPSLGILQIPRDPNGNLNRIAESFQLSERLPETLNSGNIDSSIKTLVEILNILHSTRNTDFPQVMQPARVPAKRPVYDAYKPRPYAGPKVITESRFQATPSPMMLTDDPERAKSYEHSNLDGLRQGSFHANNANGANSMSDTGNLKNVKILNNPNHLNDVHAAHGPAGEKLVEYYTPYVQDVHAEENGESFLPTTRPGEVHAAAPSTEHSYEITEDLSDDVLQDERFAPLPSTTEKLAHNYVDADEGAPRVTNVPKTALKYGVTRGKPHVDYPAYATIPDTDFSCKQQRYKGFFGDPATGCQVWHYCDLNGGKSSFLCPNGTIFSQVALTCDWWFNVKCESTTQLYVLNERLYKYILPIMPKFPEDFTGPEVDRYLEIKFKEMEAKLKEKKLKKQQEAKEKAKAKHQGKIVEE